MVINICKICNKQFISKRRSKQTCSRECFYKLLSIGKIGKLNPRFNHGWRQYHRATKHILACQNCDRKYTLETHHIDGNKRNNNPNNLLKLCRRCHMLIDGRFKNLTFGHPQGVKCDTPIRENLREGDDR